MDYFLKHLTGAVVGPPPAYQDASSPPILYGQTRLVMRSQGDRLVDVHTDKNFWGTIKGHSLHLLDDPSDRGTGHLYVLQPVSSADASLRWVRLLLDVFPLFNSITSPFSFEVNPPHTITEVHRPPSPRPQM